MNLLVDKIKIAKYRQISKSVADNKINSFISDAQTLDLMPLLGEKLYFDLLGNPNNYIDLMNAKVYQHDGILIESPGIEIVLCLFSYARYIMHGSVTDTPFGMVQKESQDSTPTPRTDKKEIYKQTQQTANEYWLQVQTYLNRNATLYPFWGSNCIPQQRKGFRFNLISR